MRYGQDIDGQDIDIVVWGMDKTDVLSCKCLHAGRILAQLQYFFAPWQPLSLHLWPTLRRIYHVRNLSRLRALLCCLAATVSIPLISAQTYLPRALPFTSTCVTLLPGSNCLYTFNQRSDVLTTCVTFHVNMRSFATWQPLSLHLWSTLRRFYVYVRYFAARQQLSLFLCQCLRHCHYMRVVMEGFVGCFDKGGACNQALNKRSRGSPSSQSKIGYKKNHILAHITSPFHNCS